MKQHLVHDKNRSSIPKSAAFLQNIVMLYLPETEIDETEVNCKDPIYLPSIATVPYQKQSIEPTFNPPSFSRDTTCKLALQR